MRYHLLLFLLLTSRLLHAQNSGVGTTVGSGPSILSVPCASGVEVFSSLGVPNCSTTLPAGLTSASFQAPVSLTTTGTSGVATFSGNVLNVPNYTSGGSITLTTTGSTGPATLSGGVLNVPNYATGSSGCGSAIASAVCVTSSGSAPGYATTLPAGLTIPGYAALGTADTFTGQQVFSFAGISGSHNFAITGTPYAMSGAYAVLGIDTAGATEPAFGSSGTMFAVNSPSGFAGNEIAVYANGVLGFSVSSAGVLTAPRVILGSSSGSTIASTSTATVPLTLNNSGATPTGNLTNWQAGGVTQAAVNIGGIFEQAVGAAIASASAIAPVAGITHVTGTAPISTITLPPGMSSTVGGCILLIANGAWSTLTGGNIGTAFTASAGTSYRACYDGTTSLWYTEANGGAGLTSLPITVGGMTVGNATTLDFESGTGIIQSCAAPTAGVLPCTPAIDSSVVLTKQTDQANTDRKINGTSGGAGGTFAATGNPTLTPVGYLQSQTFIFTPTDHGCTGADTVNIDGIGPLTLKKRVSGATVNIVPGDCAQGVPVQMIGYGSPPSAWLITPPGSADARGLVFTVGGTGTLTTASISQTITVPFACQVVGYDISLGSGNTGGVTLELWHIADGTTVPTGASIATGLALSSGTSTGHIAVSPSSLGGFTMASALAIGYYDKLVAHVTAFTGSPSIATLTVECAPQ